MRARCASCVCGRCCDRGHAPGTQTACLGAVPSLRVVSLHRARSMHGVHDDAKDKPFELELSWVCEASGWRHEAVGAQRIAAAEAWAKAQIEAEEMGEDEDD